VGLVSFLGGKRKVVQHIKSYPSLTWTVVVNGLFFDPALKRGRFVDFKNGTATVWDDGNEPFSTTNLKLIGQTLVKILTDEAAYEDSKNKYIYLSSHTTTQNEIIAAVEKATGKKVEVTKIDSAQKIAESKEKVAKGDFKAGSELISAIVFAKINGNNLTDYRELGIFNEKHGVKDAPLEEDVKNLIDSQ
jgi:NmrA-like family